MVFREDEVSGFGFYVDDHVACVVSEDASGVGSEIYQEHVGFCEHIFVGGRWFSWKFVKGWFDAWINVGVIEEGAGYGLDAAFAFGV